MFGPINEPNARGLVPTVIVFTTVLVRVLITETVPLSKFATKANAPFGVTATPAGRALIVGSIGIAGIRYYASFQSPRPCWSARFVT